MLTDNGHTILKCSKCRISLVDIWHTQPDLILKSTIKAKCAYCDGESPEVKVEGGIHLGATDDSDISDVKHLGTEYESSVMVHQNVFIITSKGK